MDTRFDICSRALTRVGLKPIASFEDGTAEATVAGREYEARVRAELAEHRWRFATKQAALNRLAETPEARWRFYHQLPGDLIQLHGVFRAPADNSGVVNLPVEYDRYGDRIATDEECPLVADYTCRPDEATWPAYFVDALAWRLAAIFARAIKRDNQQADALDARCDRILFPRARLTDSQQRTACPDVAELVWVIGVDL